MKNSVSLLYLAVQQVETLALVCGADRLFQTQVAFKALARVLMDFFGLSLDSPLVPNVDAYINPAKDEDTHRRALNAVVSARLFYIFIRQVTRRDARQFITLT